MNRTKLTPKMKRSYHECMTIAQQFMSPNYVVAGEYLLAHAAHFALGSPRNAIIGGKTRPLQ